MHLNLQTSIDATEFLVDTADSVAAHLRAPQITSWVDLKMWWTATVYTRTWSTPMFQLLLLRIFQHQTKLGATQMLRNPGYQATSTNKRREWIDNHSSFTIPQPLNGQFCGMFYTRSSQTSVCQRITCKAWKTGLLSPPPEQASHQ